MSEVKLYKSFTALKHSRNKITESLASDFEESYAAISDFFKSLKKAKRTQVKVHPQKRRSA